MDAVQSFLQTNALVVPTYPPTSRYHGIAIAQHRLADGTTVAYVRRRVVPAAERHALLHEHVVGSGDRLDNLAARYLGDPTLYWRICDANAAMRPADLTATLGRRLRITLPQDTPGVTDAG